MQKWPIYKPTNNASKRVALPPAPPWRAPGPDRSKVLAETFQPHPDVVDAVNVALFLRRPLLVTGRPGTGKSTLIQSVARSLGLGNVINWHIHSRSTLKEGLYGYDALGRLQHLQQLQLQAASTKAKVEDDVSPFIVLGPLGTALASKQPRALLIDEIDKSDVDLPNDLLNVLDNGSFIIPELQRLAESKSKVMISTCEGMKESIAAGQVRFTEFPVIIMTSNGERDFPAPFLRRCVQCTVAEPSKDELRAILRAHFGIESSEMLITKFLAGREAGTLATDQLLNAQHLIGTAQNLSEADEERLLAVLYRSLAS